MIEVMAIAGARNCDTQAVVGHEPAERSRVLTRHEKAKVQTTPTSLFKTPAEVVSCVDLSRAEKAAVLKQWEIDARLLQVASEEGMTGGEGSQLAEVKKAQKTLGVEDLEEDGAPNKTGP